MPGPGRSRGIVMVVIHKTFTRIVGSISMRSERIVRLVTNWSTFRWEGGEGTRVLKFSELRSP